VRYSYFACHWILFESTKNIHRQVISDACLRGERRQIVLAEAGRMVGIGHWRSILRIGNTISLIGIAAHSVALDSRYFFRVAGA
jgi:hypothetical protein